MTGQINSDVRFGSKADVTPLIGDVCYSPHKRTWIKARWMSGWCH